MQDSLAAAIVGHLVGDYLLQNDWMAKNKKTCRLTCAKHAFLWTFAVCFFAGWTNTLAQIILLVTHFLQDRYDGIKFWMSRINNQTEFMTGPLSPWSIIVVDNVWHLVVVWAVWKFVI